MNCIPPCSSVSWIVQMSGVISGRSGTCFLLEPLERLGVFWQSFRQEFEGDVALEPFVVGAIDWPCQNRWVLAGKEKAAGQHFLDIESVAHAPGWARQVAGGLVSDGA